MVKLSVEVHFLEINYFLEIVEKIHQQDKTNFLKQTPSKYRIYIDDDLITERDWVWDQETYICENMFAEILPDTIHTIRIHVLNFGFGWKIRLGLDKLIVNDVLYEVDDYKDKISFTIA